MEAEGLGERVQISKQMFINNNEGVISDFYDMG